MYKEFFISIIFLTIFLWLESVFPFFVRHKKRWQHVFTNIAMGSLNGALTLFIFSGVLFSLMQFTQTYHFGLLHSDAFPAWGKTILGFLVLDMWMYGWHLANHEIPLLWRFHRMHHTDKDMDTTTALRFHPGEIIASSLLNCLVFFVIGISAAHLILYKLFFTPTILFHHSNINLPEKWDKVVRTVLVTPNMHRVHHSVEPNETNSNYSSVFSFWDRILKSYRRRSDSHSITFGLRNFSEISWQKFSAMLLIPFR